MIDRDLNYGRHHIRQFLEDSRPFATVLDLGAGGGADLGIAAEVAPEAVAIAVETHPLHISRLRSKKIQVACLNIERDQLPCEAGSVDVVIANQILEHTKELFWIFHEVTRVLRRGGRFIIGVPNLASFHNRLLLAAGHQPTPIKSASAHVRGFTKPDLLDFVNKAFPTGYQLIGFGGSNFYPFPGVIARPLAALLPSLAWGIFLSLQKVQAYESHFLDFPRVNSLETNFYLGPD